MCPGCTTSNTPWHIMTFLARGRGPTSPTSSSKVLILWLRKFRLASSMDVSLCHIFEPDLAGLRNRLRIPQWRFAPIINLAKNLFHAILKANAWAPIQIAGNGGDVCIRDVRFARSFRNVDDLAAKQLHEL